MCLKFQMLMYHFRMGTYSYWACRNASALLWTLRAWRLISLLQRSHFGHWRIKKLWWKQWELPECIQSRLVWAPGTCWDNKIWDVHCAPKPPEAEAPDPQRHHLHPWNCSTLTWSAFPLKKGPGSGLALLTVWMELVSLDISGIFRWRLCNTYVVCIWH